MPGVQQQGDDLLVSTGVLCHIYGITPGALTKWKNGGCPQTKRGWYNLREVVAWRDAGTTVDAVKAGDLRTAKLAIDVQYRKTKSQKEQLLLDILKGQYYSKEDVEDGWSRRALELKTALLNWSKTLPMDLIGLDVPEMEHALYKKTCELLEEFCRNGAYTFDEKGD